MKLLRWAPSLNSSLPEKAHGGARGLLLKEFGIHSGNAGEHAVAVVGEGDHRFAVRFGAVELAVDVFVEAFRLCP